MKPSALYRGDLWRAALSLARVAPPVLLRSLAQTIAFTYAQANSSRREIVYRNLLPPLQFDRSAAKRKTRALFRNFGLKLADLWLYESGRPIDHLFLPSEHWNRFEDARRCGRGLLLLTAHIGNWEFGAELLRKHGINLQVITQAEPDQSFTQLRARSRADRGIETLVIGENPFAFVEVIRRLEAGATVALLMDRPPPPSSVTVKLFGQKFAASVAAAELARATGCLLLPTFLPRTPQGYSVQVLPEIPYERASLGNRESRANLTQGIMRQFEPAIREHIDQWYHFVPLWQIENR